MSRRIGRAFLGLAGLVVVLAAVTFAALEAGDVAVLESRDASGAPRLTHVWYVEADGVPWLEAGAPENGWFRDVQRDPTVRITIDGRTRAYRAEPRWDRDERDMVRARLRARYGWRDAWVGHFVDSARSVAVRLVPVDEPERSANPLAAGAAR